MSRARGRVSLTKLRTTFNGTPPNLIGVLGGGDPWQKNSPPWPPNGILGESYLRAMFAAFQLAKLSRCLNTTLTYSNDGFINDWGMRGLTSCKEKMRKA
jgi:hypothetical protein